MKTVIAILLLILPAAAGAQVDSIGACCYGPGSWCMDVTEAECDSIQGTWLGTCAECPMFVCYNQLFEGACCLHDGTCIITTEYSCVCEWGGTWAGAYRSCEETDCSWVSSVPDTPDPRRELTWGKLKTLYR